jgi:hypothetical protein
MRFFLWHQERYISMPRIATPAKVGSKGFDTIAHIDSVAAKRLRTAGMDYAVRYLGSLTSTELDGMLEAGLKVMPVTYGMKHGTQLSSELGRKFGNSTVNNAKAAGVPVNTTVWLDLEDCKGNAQEVSDFVNQWAFVVKDAGFMPGLYVGFGAVLSSQELYALGVVRYWQSLSKETDARGLLAEPNCGWCMIQLYPPNQQCVGVQIDYDVIQADYKGRVPNWIALG